MDFSSICRTCMNNNKTINPIFFSDDDEKFSNAIYLCTGIQIKLNDGLPQNMCTTCMNQLNNCIKFRKQCKYIETQLLGIKNNLKTVSSAMVLNKDSMLKTIMNSNSLTNGSNITDIKTEFNAAEIKSETSVEDFDEDQPLKFYKHNSNITILKTNKIDSDNSINNKKNSYKNKKELKSEKILSQTIDKDDEIENTKLYKCVVYTKLPQKTSSKSLEIEYSDSEDSNTDHNVIDSSVDNIMDSNVTNNGKDSNITDNGMDSNITDNGMDSNITDKIKDSNNKFEAPFNVITDTVSSKVRVLCKLCQTELSIRSIDEHMDRKHPGLDERKVKCELCDTYIMRKKLARHRNMMHGVHGFKCRYCKIEYKTKESLVDHVPTCTAKGRNRNKEPSRVMIECDVCNRKMQKASLSKHKAVMHAGLRPVCEHCGISFGNKFRLNEHYRAKHGYEKIKCKYCDFQSAGVLGMRNHERRHRGEKPFVCEICDAKFHAAYLLMQHKHSHRTEKLVKCELCPATFKANNNLHMHKLTCHSKRLYRCSLCSKTYKCQQYATKHVRVTHNISDSRHVIQTVV